MFPTKCFDCLKFNFGRGEAERRAVLFTFWLFRSQHLSCSRASQEFRAALGPAESNLTNGSSQQSSSAGQEMPAPTTLQHSPAPVGGLDVSPWAIGIPVRDCSPRAGSLLSPAWLGALGEARRSPRASLIHCQWTLVTKPEVRWEEPDPLAFCSQGFETLKVHSSLDLFHPTDIISLSEVTQSPLTT